MRRFHLTMFLAAAIAGLFLTIAGTFAQETRAQEPPRQTLDQLIAGAIQPTHRCAKNARLTPCTDGVRSPVLSEQGAEWSISVARDLLHHNSCQLCSLGRVGFVNPITRI
jgi:hypothetical protein